MKTSKIQKNTLPYSHSSKPFFNKSGEGSFISQTKESNTPFFSPYPVQTKLTVGQPNDKYEQEADMMAENVVQKLESTASSVPIQMKYGKCDQGQTLQKKEEEVEEIGLMRKPVSEGNDASHVQTNSIENQLNASKGKGNHMSNEVRSDMESAFETDFSSIKIHTDSSAVQMNKELSAKAFTHKQDVFFNKEQYNPKSSSGKKLLAHELTHTVQQTGKIQRSSLNNKAFGTVLPEDDVRGTIENKTKSVQVGSVDEEMPSIQKQEDTSQSENGGNTNQNNPNPESDDQGPSAPTINFSPGTTLTRGDLLNADVQFQSDSGATLNVTGWRFITPNHGTVIRRANSADFQSQWSGVMAESGTLELSFRITPASGTQGSIQTIQQNIIINDRANALFTSNVTQPAESVYGGRPSPPRVFRNLGLHQARITGPTLTPTAISSGPNRRFRFISNLTPGTYSSQPLIHPDLTNSSSDFFLFHLNPSRLYVVQSSSSRVLVPLADYSNLQVSGGTTTFVVPDWEAFYKAYDIISVTATAESRTITVPNRAWGLNPNDSSANVHITDDPLVRSLLNIGQSVGYSLSWNSKNMYGFELMQASDILTGTRSHEYQHAVHSHRANFLKMMRALDPQQIIENRVSAPGHTLNHNSIVTRLITEILRPNHELVDENASRTQENFVAISGQTMAGVNTDPGTGNSLGSVWNISADEVMT